MSDYFLSDVHLRDDRPERGRRLVRFLERVTTGDSLLIAGDLCDFWMGSRKSSAALARDPAMRALTGFREAGGRLAILPGNHATWLVPFYGEFVGAAILGETASIESHGLRLHVVHGHLLGARKKWKGAMESAAFFKAFGYIPYPAARALDAVLEAKNRRGLLDDEERHLSVFRDYASRLTDTDVAVFGHVHRAVDEAGPPRLVVLGGWQHRPSYLKIDHTGASLHVERGEPAVDADRDAPINRDAPSHASS